ncbi:MAG: hypothetical protein HQL19_05305 [Candidatus Omnitrophica bacterium]|nr:hypothetical protein [Candidatus Omnitrophota bacterium]
MSFIQRLTSRQKDIRRVIIERTHRLGLSHLGSCFCAVDVIDAVYSNKKLKEKFVLSAGHSAMALYAVMETKGLLPAKVIDTLHIHPDRDVKRGIEVSSGSLGQGLPIALGMALADRTRRIYCLVTDGECAEGSIWESLRVMKEQKVRNLTVMVVANGWAAYTAVDARDLLKRLRGFVAVVSVNGHDSAALASGIKEAIRKNAVLFAKTTPDQLPFLKGLAAHYHVMSANDHAVAMEALR